MASDGGDQYTRYASIPIPTYDEAISHSAPSHEGVGPGEDVERQGLLGHGQYRRPTVESARSSLDNGSDAESDLSVPELTEERAHRHVEAMDYLDPSTEDGLGRHHRPRRVRGGSKLSHHLSYIGATLTSFRLPSFRALYSPLTNPLDNVTPAPTESWFKRFRSRLPSKEQFSVSAPIFARLCGLFTIGALIWVLFAMDLYPSNMRQIGTMYDPESVRVYVQESADAQSIQDFLYKITLYDHTAGTEGDLYLARWMEEQWIEEGGLDDIAILDYYVYLNYPTEDGRSVSIVHPEDKAWTAKLEEENAYPESMNRKQTLAWHGHSKNGEVEGPLIYANGGDREDFKWLNDNNIKTNGTIALVRYYASQGDRALKIKAAEDAGCVGVLIYSDPSDDGAGKGPVWPDGPWRPADGLQRGGVSMMSWVVGDPLTPGWASTLDAERVSKDNNPGLVGIPSLPLAWRDAEVLLRAINGRGAKVPREWLGYTKDLKDWTTGDSGPDAPIVHLKNMNDESSLQQIWNLHGLIRGAETPEKKIIVGNHRDAWCFGSVDPGSGSAVMMEIVSIFSQLRLRGWRPLRTIEFVSWDAEEYNLVGSSEYVEDNIDYLRDNGIAYLNVDVGVSGPNFRAAASPLWSRPLLRVLNRVTDPHSNATLKQLWDEQKSGLDGLGAGSDYVAFQDLAGTSSIDFGFEGPDYGYPYHSCYENFEWMTNFGDPGMQYHRTLAQVWALLILELSDRPIIPYDLNIYAEAVHAYIDNLEKDFKAMTSSEQQVNIDFSPLRSAAANLTRYAEEFHHFEDIWTTKVLGQGGLEPREYTLKRLEYNERITRFETDLLDLPDAAVNDQDDEDRKYGVPGREQFKHVIFGPQAWSGYDEAYFPAVRDAIAAGNWNQAQQMIKIAARRIERAGQRLVE